MTAVTSPLAFTVTWTWKSKRRFGAPPWLIRVPESLVVLVPPPRGTVRVNRQLYRYSIPLSLPSPVPWMTIVRWKCPVAGSCRTATRRHPVMETSSSVQVFSEAGMVVEHHPEHGRSGANRTDDEGGWCEHGHGGDGGACAKLRRMEDMEAKVRPCRASFALSA